MRKLTVWLVGVAAVLAVPLSPAVLAADSCMITPTPGVGIVSGRFGKFRSGGAANSGSANQKPHMHDGLDFSTGGASVPLVAASAGTIMFMGARGSAGNTILIKRPSGDVVGYYHMSGFAPDLRQGSTVTAGQSLGISGNSPVATLAKHLHLVYGTNDKDVVRAAAFPATAAQGPFNPGQLANVFNQQAGIGWKTDPAMYFCNTYQIVDGHPGDVAILGGDTKAQHAILFDSGTVANNLKFDAQQVIAANADAALAAAAGKPAGELLSDKESYGSLPTAPLGGYETMSTSEMMMTEANRRLSDADWNANVVMLDERGLWVDYVRVVGVSNFMAAAILKKRERIEALMAVYTSLKLKSSRQATMQAQNKAQTDHFQSKIQP